MKSAKTTGRALGLLLLLHLITGLTTPYIMLRPLATPVNFSENNLTNAGLVRTSVMMLFVGGALTIAISVTAFPVIRQASYGLALWLVALSTANFALQCVENAAWMSMFTLSRDFATATAANAGAHQIAGAAVRAAWKWVHYTHLLILVVWMLLLFASLGRAALLPRLLAALGVIASLFQITGITLPQFLAYPSPAAMLMGMSLGVVYLMTSIWLMVRGFKSNPREA